MATCSVKAINMGTLSDNSDFDLVFPGKHRDFTRIYLSVVDSTPAIELCCSAVFLFGRAALALAGMIIKSIVISTAILAVTYKAQRIGRCYLKFDLATTALYGLIHYLCLRRQPVSKLERATR